MTISPWVFYGLAAGLVAALMPLVQERYRATPLAMAFGTKVFVALFTLPIVLAQGLPQQPLFYGVIAVTSLIWCVSDVFYYRTVATVGAGPVSRLLAGMIVPGFVLWLIVNPSLVMTYAQEPGRAAGIAACVALASWLAMRLSRCTVTRHTARLLWFTCVAAATAPTMIKLTLGTAQPTQAPYALPFIEALFMMSYWAIYSLYTEWRRGAGHARSTTQLMADLRQPNALKAGLLMGLFGGSHIVLMNLGIQSVEHPSYIAVLNYTDVLWIVVIYRLLGRREDAKVLTGLGLALCAAALVLLKSL